MMLPQSYPIACLWCFCKCVVFGFCAPPILWPLPLKFLCSSLRLFCCCHSLRQVPMPVSSSRLLAVVLVTKFLSPSLRLVCWLSFSSPSSYARLVCCCRSRRQVLLSSRLASSVAVSRRQVRLGCRSLPPLVCALGPLLQCVSARIRPNSLKSESSPKSPRVSVRFRDPPPRS
jgi:hypothetical protein